MQHYSSGLKRQVVVIGAGPAGLMAAERLADAGLAVTIYERMPSAGRRLLMAGRGGLNLTHSEPLEQLLSRYGLARERLEPAIRAFPPSALRAWAEKLGQETFVGSSGRVFPRAMKASPLLRAWLARLQGQGVRPDLRHQWRGWGADGRLRIKNLAGEEEAQIAPDAVLLALGGGSWPRLGADATWLSLVAAKEVEVKPFRPANCGFSLAWSDSFRERFAGSPLKNIAATFRGRRLTGEATVSDYGLEGSVIYALSASLRDAIEQDGQAQLLLDLRPDLSEAALRQRLTRVPESASFANLSRKGAGLSSVATNLVRELWGPERDAVRLAAVVKEFPVTLKGVQPLEKAISSAGGIAWPEVETSFMLRRLPGVFVAGEMLDWEAPTGGYLLQACIATGLAAAEGMLAYLEQNPQAPAMA